jgi:foldase protein PrsA
MKQCKYYRRRAILFAALLLVCAVLSAGCGRIIMTTGYADDQVFQMGGKYTGIGEVRVYLLDQIKNCQALLESGSLSEAEAADMKESIKNKAISQISRVKALNFMAIADNIMLTDEEEQKAADAAQRYFNALSAKEKAWLLMDAEELTAMFREYALADKVWQSLGDSFEDRYNTFIRSLDSDLNLKLWNSIEIEPVDPEADAGNSFIAAYNNIFGG